MDSYKVAEKNLKEMEIILDKDVKMSHVYSVPRYGSIGTFGCAVCLGVLVIYKDEVYCAHSCCEIVFKKDDPNIPKIIILAQNMFTNNFPQDKEIEEIYCVASDSKDCSNIVLYEGLKLAFGDKVKPIENSDNIYWSGSEVSKLKTNWILKGRMTLQEDQNGTMMIRNSMLK